MISRADRHVHVHSQSRFHRHRRFTPAAAAAASAERRRRRTPADPLALTEKRLEVTFSVASAGSDLFEREKSIRVAARKPIPIYRHSSTDLDRLLRYTTSALHFLALNLTF